MPEQRSVLKEYRDLDEKRLTRGLSPDEQARFARLRDLVGASAGAPAVKPGFDVNAAAAALRESLLPAGLRNRPPPTPAPAPQADAGPTSDDLAAADALASAYEEALPVAEHEGAAAAPQDALFDPAALGSEPAPYDPNAAYAADPNAQPYDPAAYPAEPAYDASGQPAWSPDQPWDPNAAQEPQPYDPNAVYPADPNALAYDPDAPADPNAAYAADPNAQPYDPNAAYPADAAYDAGGQPAWSPDQPWDPNAAQEAQPGDAAGGYPADPNALAYDPNAPADPNAAYAADPNAQPYDPNAAYPADAAYGAGGEPGWSPDQPWDPNAVQAGEAVAYPTDADAAYPADPSAPDAGEGAAQSGWTVAEAGEGEAWDASTAPTEGGTFAPPDAGTAAGWDAEPPPPEPVAGADFGEYDAAGTGLPLVTDAALAEAPPPEPDFAEAPPAATAPAAPELGEYDETVGFAAQPFEAAAVPEEALALESARPPPELETSWQPDAALDAGFQAESGGSFGADADAAAPEWAQAPASPPWEGAPALDLAAAPEPAGGAAPELDFSQPDLSGPEEAAPELDAAAAPAGEDAGPFAPELADLPPEDAGATLPPLDLSFEPGADASAPVPAFAEPALAAAILPEPELAAPELEPPEPEAPPAADLAPSSEPEPADAAELPQLADIAEVTEITEVTDVEGAPAPLARAAGVEPDLSFDVAEEAAPAAAPEPAAEAPAGIAVPVAAAAAMAEEEIPTIDGADILEEIIEDVPSAPPQSLDFEPLAPASVRAAVPPPPEPSAPAPELAVAAPAAVAPPAPPAPPAPSPAPAASAPSAAPSPPAASAPPCVVPGSHRVVVHTVEGLVRRGVLEEPDLASAALALAPQAGAPVEEVATEKVKAIFFMLAPGEKPPAAEGRRVRVTFRDGRQIAGFSPDYRDDGIGFFMIPADTRTNTGRIWVFRSAVRQVSVS